MMPLAPTRRFALHMLLAATCVASSAALYLWSCETANQAQAAQQHALQDSRQLTQRLQQAATDTTERARLLPFYHQLDERGLFRSIDPPALIERLRQLQKELQLPGLRYEIQPPDHPAAPENAMTPVISTPLTVHLSLLHEEDLLRFLAALSEQAPGLPCIRRCRVWRSAAPMLAADCHIELFTLVPAAP